MPFLGFPPSKLLKSAVFLLVLGGAGTAFAGSMRGRITGQDKLLPEVFVEASKGDSHRFNWREPSPTVRPEFRTLSANPSRDVCIAAMSANTPPAHDPILIKITGGHTIPTTLVVSPGTRLAFENRDPFPHRLYIPGNDGWKAEDTSSGGTRQWTATAAGRVEFRDQLFPSVRMYVVIDPQVVDTAFPGRDGTFAMDKLPAGEYVLKAFFNGKQVGRPASVVVKDRGALELKEPLNVSEGSDPK